MRSRLCATGVLAIAVLSGWSLSWCASQRPSNRSTWGRILVIGDEQESQSGRDFAELYDPATNQFAVRRPAMKNGRNGASATVIPSGANAGKILLVGGWTDRTVKKDVSIPVSLASTELYDAATRSFAQPDMTATLKAARAFHTATVISSGPNAGGILIAGGQRDDENPLSSTEIYDPATNSFKPGPAMDSPRSQHAAIVIASGSNAGKILIAGGMELGCYSFKRGCAPALLSSTEIYDPTTNTFTPGPEMRAAPGQKPAIQLPQAPPR